MPKPTKGARLGGSPAHERLLLANLATALFEHGRVKTTEAKARRVRPLAEKLITKAKKGDLHNRRLVARTILDKGVVHALFTEIAPTFAERPGGYTRITKLGPRRGDNAPMAMIELVTGPVTARTGRSAARTADDTAAKAREEAAQAKAEAAEAKEEAAEAKAEAAEAKQEAADAKAETAESAEAGESGEPAKGKEA